MMSGVAIETGLVVLLSLLPIVEKAIGRMTNLGEENAVLIFQSIIVAYIVKTCKLLDLRINGSPQSTIRFFDWKYNRK